MTSTSAWLPSAAKRKMYSGSTLSRLLVVTEHTTLASAISPPTALDATHPIPSTALDATHPIPPTALDATHPIPSTALEAFTLRHPVPPHANDVSGLRHPQLSALIINLFFLLVITLLEVSAHPLANVPTHTPLYIGTSSCQCADTFGGSFRPRRDYPVPSARRRAPGWHPSPERSSPFPSPPSASCPACSGSSAGASSWRR